MRGLVLDRWDKPDLPMEPAEVEPVDALGDGDLEVVDVTGELIRELTLNPDVDYQPTRAATRKTRKPLPDPQLQVRQFPMS